MILLTYSSCHAASPHRVRGHLECADANPLFGVIPPKHADCRVVLAQLPRLHHHDLNTWYPANRAVNLAPFLPPLSIGHGTCRFFLSFLHGSQIYNPSVERTGSQVLMAAVWSYMRFGAKQIVDGCRTNVEYGTYKVEMEMGDEGVTTIFVSNMDFVSRECDRRDALRRLRERVGVRLTVEGEIRTDYDEDENFSLDQFATQSFDV